MTEKRKTEVVGKFSTPIWTGLVDNIEETNKDLKDYINKIKNKNPEGIKKSNIFGWHSPDLSLKDEKMQNFFQTISPMIKNVADDMRWDIKNFEVKILSCWSIINYKHAYNAAHIHANALISSAYYVEAPDKCGDIIFDDPRPGATIKKGPYSSVSEWNQGNIRITPKPGLLIMFPSYLTHHVQPNMSEKERTIISFNLDVARKNT